eukprot:CAMPEP_0117510034 /NCGR_PEP_ID=MMETSP0784-20121206/27782_1 /TAXON_ID=39447 /ORGANISM="" /LENGTH=480 /DNA_ID=CAMNT_0005305659 /DNA_START=99 /DNA_END=1541 /DNA_ORIENTATION=+
MAAGGIRRQGGSGCPVRPAREPGCAFGDEEKMATKFGTTWTLEAFRKKAGQILAEYFLSEELEEAVQCLEEMKCGDMHDELVVFAARKAMDHRGGGVDNSGPSRGLALVAALLVKLHTRSVLENAVFARAFEKLFCTWQDMALDVPDCANTIVELLGECIEHGCLSSHFFAKLPEGLIKGYTNQRYREKLAGVREGLQKFKAWANACLEEYFVAKSVEEVRISAQEKGMWEYRHEFVKKAILVAFDRAAADVRVDGSLDATIVLLAHLHRCETLSKDDIYWGTIRMLGTIEDVMLDCPTAPDLATDFLCAAVVEELISVPFLKRCRLLRTGGPSAKSVLEEVERKFPEYTRAHIGEQDFKAELRQTILEYFDANDKDEVRKVVQEMQPLGDERAGELVRKVCVFAMERSGEECDLALNLLEFLHKHEEIESLQLAAGFEQIYERMDDLILDVPDALEMVESFVRQARQRQLLPKGWEPGV